MAFELRMDTALRFGKHNGKTVAQILDEAPDYLLWLQKQFEADGFQHKNFSTEVVNLIYSRTNTTPPDKPATANRGNEFDDEAPF